MVKHQRNYGIEPVLTSAIPEFSDHISLIPYDTRIVFDTRYSILALLLKNNKSRRMEN